MKLARPEEIDDRSKTARVSIKVELVVLEKSNSTQFQRHVNGSYVQIEFVA